MTDRSRPALLSLAWCGLPLLVTGYQVASKRIADDLPPGGGSINWAGPLYDPLIAPLVLCEIGSFVLWMYILARMSLSRAFPMSSIAYVLVLAASWLLFGEGATLGQLAGSAAIVGGVFLLGAAEE